MSSFQDGPTPAETAVWSRTQVPFTKSPAQKQGKPPSEAPPPLLVKRTIETSSSSNIRPQRGFHFLNLPDSSLQPQETDRINFIF